MIYLLDTNIVSGLMRGEGMFDAWISTLSEEDRLITCSIVRGEILFGVERLPLGRRKIDLRSAALRILDELACEPVPVAAGDLYAGIKRRRQLEGLSLDENDLWIASTALSLGATLVTRDRDFDGIEGLRTVIHVP